VARQIIGVDIDDVLSATAEGFTTYSNERWGNKRKVEQYTEAWVEFWGVSTGEAIKRSDEYHSSDVISQFSYYEQAAPVLRELSKKYKIVVITSRRKMLKTLTDAWLEKYFPTLFEEVHYAGIWDTVGNNRPTIGTVQLPDGVVRAEDWHGVGEYFYAQG
jgi:uncharacterized HAD superfamily protein